MFFFLLFLFFRFFSAFEYSITYLFFFGNCLILCDFISIFFIFFSLVIFLTIVNFCCYYIIANPNFNGFLLRIIIFYYFMLIFVLSRNFFQIFLRWETIRVLSFLLIMFWKGRPEALSGALQAIIYNRFRDFFFFCFICLMLVFSSSLNFIVLRKRVIWFLFLFAFFVKSSIFPFHNWLPNAMERPTPVSALLHSSTIVVARVFLVLRIVNFFPNTITFCLLVFGLITFFFRSFLAYFGSDIKKIVAYSTVSHLRLIVINSILLRPIFSFFHIVVHRFFKASLFISSRYIIHFSFSNQNFFNNLIFMLKDNLTKYYWFLNSLILLRLPYLSLFIYKETPFFLNIVMINNSFIFFLYVISIVFSILYSIKLIQIQILFFPSISFIFFVFENSYLFIKSSKFFSRMFFWIILFFYLIIYHNAFFFLNLILLFFLRRFFFLKEQIYFSYWNFTNFLTYFFFSILENTKNNSYLFDFYLLEKIRALKFKSKKFFLAPLIFFGIFFVFLFKV